MTVKILVVGGSGLIGRQVVERLADGANADTHIVLRSALANGPANVQQLVAAVPDWPTQIAALAPEIVINCLGTTMRIAGSQAAFRAVDHDLVLAVAQAARQSGSRHCISVSSVGASDRASNFYLKTKGEVETALRAMGFDRLDIMRPGLLTGGARPETRFGEQLGIMLSPLTDLLLPGPLSRYRSTPSKRVADAIVRLTADATTGTYIHENDSISALSG